MSLSAESTFIYDLSLPFCTFATTLEFISPIFHLCFVRTGPGQYETRLLETSIQKITALLRVGFGEAGAGIISANLKTRDSSATIDPLLPGGEHVYSGFYMLFSLFFLCVADYCMLIEDLWSTKKFNLLLCCTYFLLFCFQCTIFQVYVCMQSLDFVVSTISRISTKS